MNKKRKYIIGNWKMNKSISEVEDWFRTFTKLYHKKKNDQFSNLEIVICPSFIYLPLSADLCKSYNLPIKLGAQDVSPFINGPYTGEISAAQLAPFTQYVIVGHSERRTNFVEDDKILTKKVERCQEAGIEVIYCIPDENTLIPEGISLVAYEPVWAIGSGKSDTPKNANRIASTVKMIKKVKSIIYGGSVTPENIVSFLKTSQIDGVLPGGASLDAASFWQMILNAASI